MPEFSRRINIQIIKSEPLTAEAFWRYHDHNLNGDDVYERYVDRFQPYRWRAMSENNKTVAHGESYANEADAINAVELLFGDNTTMYWVASYGEDDYRTYRLLRYSKTDRSHLAAANPHQQAD